MLLKYFTVPIVTGIFSAGMFSVAAYVFYNSYKTASWPSTEGRIHYSDERKRGSTSGPKGPVLSVTVHEAIYTYTVNGYEHYGTAPINSVEAESPSKAIKVYYNSNNPSQSILYNGVHWPYIIGFSFMGILSAYVAYSWRKP